LHSVLLNARLELHYGKGLIYLMANISANKIGLLQGQSYIEGKCYNGSKKLNLKIHKWLMIN